MSTNLPSHRRHFMKILAALAIGAGCLTAAEPDPPKLPPTDTTEPKILPEKDDLDRSIEGFQQKLEEMERAYGPSDRAVLKLRSGIASMLLKKGRNAEAEAEYKVILKLKQTILGPDHPDMLSSRKHLALSLALQGKNVEAEAELRALIKLQDADKGIEQDEMLITRRRLANVLWAQGKNIEGDEQQRLLINESKQILGENNPTVLSQIYFYSRILAPRDRKKALEVAKPLVEASRMSNGLQHRDTQAYEAWVEELSKPVQPKEQPQK